MYLDTFFPNVLLPLSYIQIFLTTLFSVVLYLYSDRCSFYHIQSVLLYSYLSSCGTTAHT
jgi:hypothetical protein